MKILIIQTSFIGDVILTTPLLENLHQHFPEAKIDFLLKKGNESLFNAHPFLNQVIVFDKSKNKIGQMLELARNARSEKYDLIINLHRHFTSGYIAVRAKGKKLIGFDKNPFSFLYNVKVKHHIGTEGKLHETERNLALLKDIAPINTIRPKLYPSESDFINASKYKNYVCIAPASVWFTKQLPEVKWVELIQKMDSETTVILLGGKEDKTLCESIKTKLGRGNIEILAGSISLLGSAALMQNAKMNYVNDSSPLHLASSVNAPVTAFFCSTVPEFGFGPLSDNSKILQHKEKLACKPCGLHGHRACPKGHFKCGEIDLEV